MEQKRPKILPPLEMPTEQDFLKAQDFVLPPDWPNDKIFTDEIRRDINKVARQIMMSRKTIH